MVTKDDKAIYKMIENYLTRAMDAINELSPDGAHELAIVISDNELPHIGDIQTLVNELKRLQK